MSTRHTIGSTRKAQPTAVEMLVLRAVRDHIRRNGISPSYEEIAEAVERTKDTIRGTLRRLIGKGLLKKMPMSHRSLTVTEAGLYASRKRISK